MNATISITNSNLRCTASVVGFGGELFGHMGFIGHVSSSKINWSGSMYQSKQKGSREL